MFCQVLGLDILNESEVVTYSLFKLFYVYGCFAHIMYVCAPCMYIAPTEAREGIRSPDSIVTDGCEQPHGTVN